MNWTRVAWEAKMRHPNETLGGRGSGRIHERRRRTRRRAFAADYPGHCATCHRPFPKNTLIVFNKNGKVVHSGGCPKKKS
jgi:hypothetical protein